MSLLFFFIISPTQGFFKCWLGIMSWFKKVYHWFLHISWRLFDFLERKEANHHLSFFCWSSYHVLAVTTSEIVNLQQLLYDFGITCFTPTLLFCDNQAAIHIASNPILHKRTKHFEIDCDFVHDKVNDRFINSQRFYQVIAVNTAIPSFVQDGCKRYIQSILRGMYYSWVYHCLHHLVYLFFLYFVLLPFSFVLHYVLSLLFL